MVAKFTFDGNLIYFSLPKTVVFFTQPVAER